MWFLYEVLLLIGLLGYVPKALWRRRLPHRGWRMRLGRYPSVVTERFVGHRPIWVHAVSVGEVLAIKPLLQRFTQMNLKEPLVLSTITPSGFEVATAQIKGQGVTIYFPLDLRWCVTRALDTVHPRALLLVESELWPVAIHLAKARRIPVAVINGRISARAFRRYRWVKPWLKSMLQSIDVFLMQSQTDAERIIQLGAPTDRVHVVGSLKWDASVGARPSAQSVEEMRKRLGLAQDILVIVAGSTHRGEERALLNMLSSLRTTHPQVRLIIAPRHLERLSEVEQLVQDAGLAVVRTSGAAAGQAWDVALVDGFGQLPHYYALATVVFIGGSLIPHGGQNPLEAASVGKAMLFGPSMDNFQTIVHQLLAHHAARQEAGAHELETTLRELLLDLASAQLMGQRAQELTERFQGATQRTLDALHPLLTKPL